jgi:putative Holliday junction resolvase
MRKIGLDIGDVRIGVAVSDLSGIIASPRETYQRRSVDADAEYFKKLAETENADELVLGLPVNMDGTKGTRARLIEEYGDALFERTGLKISYIDERLTTVQAERALLEYDMRRDKRKQTVDKVAASLILQTYLDKIGRK